MLAAERYAASHRIQRVSKEFLSPRLRPRPPASSISTNKCLLPFEPQHYDFRRLSSISTDSVSSKSHLMISSGRFAQCCHNSKNLHQKSPLAKFHSGIPFCGRKHSQQAVSLQCTAVFARDIWIECELSH